MNLLDKNWSRLLIGVALTIFSCEDSSNIGLDLDPDGIRLDVLYAELPLETTNVFIDSAQTSTDVRLLAGRNVDPVFGETQATAFCRLNYKNGLPTNEFLIDDPEETYIIDSAVLYMQIRKVHTNQDLTEQTFRIYQLADTVFSGASYQAKHSSPYHTDRLEGVLSFLPQRNRILDADSLKYMVNTRLEDSFAERILGYFRDDASTAASKIFFEYNGIAIVGDPANTALVGFHPSDSTSIRIHYHIQDYYTDSDKVRQDSLYIDSLYIELGMSSAYYSNITVDRSSSLMNIVNEEYSSFTVGNQNIYLQPASGIYPKVSLDTLIEFFEERPNIQINRMEFYVETRANGDWQDNVQNLRFLYVNGEDGSRVNPTGLITNNPFSTAVLSDNGYLAGLPEIIVAPLDETSLTYTEIPTFFAQLFENKSIDSDHLILMPEDVTTPDYSVFDEENGFRIKLYYTLPE